MLFWSVEISPPSKDVQSCTRELSSPPLTWRIHLLRVRSYHTAWRLCVSSPVGGRFGSNPTESAVVDKRRVGRGLAGVCRTQLGVYSKADP